MSEETSNGPELTPQEPGAIGGVDQGKLEALVDGTVGDLVGALDSLTDDELEQLAGLEKAGKGRTTALGAITREQQQRAVDGANPTQDAPTNDRAPLGDAASYAQMHARDVDPRKLEHPVLTLDGWVLPYPKAEAQG